MGSVAVRSRKVETAKVGLREKKQQKILDAIWSAAIDLFAEKGFDETTIDEIAESAEVSRRSFFRYFESKNDLLAKPLLQYAQTLETVISALPSKLSPAETLREVTLHIAPGPLTDPRVRKLMTVVEKYPTAREAQMSRAGHVKDCVAAAYARRFKDEVLAQVAASLTMSMIYVMYQGRHRREKADTSATLDRVMSAVRQLLETRR